MPPQRSATSHSAAEVQRPDSSHLQTGQKAPAGDHAPHGGGRRSSEQADRGRTLWSPVPWVSNRWCEFIWIRVLDSGSTIAVSHPYLNILIIFILNT